MDKVITTADVVTRLADKGYTKKDSAVVIGDVLDVIYEAIARGEDVRLTGFGAFGVIDTKPKKIMNIHTGKTGMVESHKKVTFRPGEALKRAANGLIPSLAKNK